MTMFEVLAGLYNHRNVYRTKNDLKIKINIAVVHRIQLNVLMYLLQLLF